MKLSAILILLLLIPNVYADSKRIEVYSIGKSYWDVKPGDSLGLIVEQLLPNNTDMRANLIKDIVKLNPDAFVNGDINYLKADVRLWLPGGLQGLNKTIDKNKYIINEYSWGYTKKTK